MLTLKVNLTNNNFTKAVRDADGNLQQIVQFIKVDTKHTKIVSSMVGFGKGADWDKTYDFFLNGNTWIFKKILEL